MKTSLVKKFRKEIVLLTAALTLLVTGSQAIAQMGGGPGAGRSMRGPMYDVSTETTVKGTVEDVQQLTAQTTGNSQPMWGRCPKGWTGTHIVLRTDEGALTVHVGPEAYLVQKNFALAKGDNISITGSKLQYQGSDFLIAKEITKGDQTLMLRDASGFPMWAGARRGTPMPNAPAK